MRKFLIGSMSIAAIIIVSALGAKMYSSVQFNNEVRALFRSSGTTSQNTFTYARLTGLPDPVQRYFKHVLKEGQPYIRYVRLKHGGTFRTSPDADWMAIEGEEYFTADTPGFIWKGQTTLFTARDMYLLGSGGLKVSLISFIPLMNKTGPQYDQGELLRWLGENVWFPTNLLPDRGIYWTPIDSLSSNMIYVHQGDTLAFKVTFNHNNEISRLETRRFMDENRMADWVIKLTDYNESGNILVPMKAEVMWRLVTGDFSYARFTIRKIEYDKPEMF